MLESTRRERQKLPGGPGDSPYRQSVDPENEGLCPDQGGGHVTKMVAEDALTWLGVDSAGFDEMDRKILLTVIEKFGGGPVGIESLAAAVQEDKGTLEDVYEPYLIQAGVLERTGRGRQVTRLAYDHFKKTKDLLSLLRRSVELSKSLNPRGYHCNRSICFL